MLDACFRLAYRAAYKMMRVYWRAVHPYNRGALVALWHEGRVLLIQNSYVDYSCLPGGGVRPQETPRQAAARELAEELSLQIQPSQLTLELDMEHEWEGRRDHVAIFSITLADEPQVRVDNREVIGAKFVSPEQALARPLFPPLRRYLAAQLDERGPGVGQRSSSAAGLDRVSGYPALTLS